MKEYEKIEINGDIPKAMKIVMVFIDRVGFPVLAFCLMFWMSYSSLEKTTQAITANTSALLEFQISTKEFRGSVVEAHRSFDGKITQLLSRQ